LKISDLLTSGAALWSLPVF